MARTVAYFAYWDQVRALTELAGTPGLYTTCPSWYAPDVNTGAIIKQEATVVDSQIVVDQMKAKSQYVMPALANYVNKVWSYTYVSPLLAGPLRTTFLDNIVALCVTRGFDGIDIDFEHLVAADRDNLSGFVADLTTELHGVGKRCSVVVHPKAAEPGPQPRHQAQNYAALGAAADELRIMLYDYHYETPPAGPVAPISWVRSTLQWAVTQVDPAKLCVGFATYGYDWPATGDGESIMWAEIEAIRAPRGIQPFYSTVDESPWFNYTATGNNVHTVYYENARSLREKARYAQSVGVEIVHYWRLGGIDPDIDGFRSGALPVPTSYVANVAKGKTTHYMSLPGAADSVGIMLLKAAGLEADDVLNDYDTLGALLAGSNDEADFTGYVRRTLAGAVVTVNNSENRGKTDATDPAAWTNTGATEQLVGKALVYYKPETTSPDADLIPLFFYDAPLTFTPGVAITVKFNAQGMSRAA